MPTDTIRSSCDAARDYLHLPGDYMAPASPKVEASWDASTCTLTLAPAAGFASLATAEFQAAMRAVLYSNLDAMDPTNGWVASTDVKAKRRVQVRVTDAASGGLTSGTATSAAGVYSYVTIATVDDAPTLSLAAAYGVGGMLYDTDANANWKTTVIGRQTYRLRKFSLAVDPTLRCVGGGAGRGRHHLAGRGRASCDQSH